MGDAAMSGFRQKATEAIRDAQATARPDRKVRLLALAQAWLDLAEREERLLEVEVGRKPKDIRDGNHSPKDAQRQSLG